MRRVVVFVATVCCAVPLVRAAGTDKPDPEGATASIYAGAWLEISVESGHGVTKDPFDLCGRSFGRDGEYIWSRRGELSGVWLSKVGVVVDAKADPMRIDFPVETKGEVHVTPCIFRLDKDKLTIVRPSGPSQKLRKDGAYPTRPTTFAVTKENRYVKTVHVMCHVFDQD